MSDFKTKKEIILSFIKRIVSLLILPTILIWLFFEQLVNEPIKELQLITKSKSIKGFIFMAKEGSEPVEKDYRGGVGMRLFFTYRYYFNLPNGSNIIGEHEQNGKLPFFLKNKNLSVNPYQIEVEYLPENPETNRVKGMDDSYDSIYEWVRFWLLTPLIIFAIVFYLIYWYINSYIKRFKSELSMYNSLLSATIQELENEKIE